MLFFLESLSMSQKSVPLQCVFHSIRFKVNKGWSTPVLLFLCPKLNFGTFFSVLLHYILNEQTYSPFMKLCI